MKKRFLLVLSGLFAVQFLLAQNPPVEPPKLRQEVESLSGVLERD
jgi:hypothetical protein